MYLAFSCLLSSGLDFLVLQPGTQAAQGKAAYQQSMDDLRGLKVCGSQIGQNGRDIFESVLV